MIVPAPVATDAVPDRAAPSLSVTGLRRDFGSATAVDGISFEVPDGAFLVLLGPSGCGKTTTLRMLAGLDQPTGGTIRFGDRVVADGDTGVSVAAANRGAGLVFQSYALWPHKSVRGNIDWPLRMARWTAEQRRSRIAEVLELLDITELADRYPGEISGGQQQRVAIARMIASKPKYLLFDEPLSNLDAKLRVETRSELMRLHRATGATSVYVTHDQVEAMTMATHVALLNHGRIEQFGTPLELLQNPQTAFTSTFIGTPPANLAPGPGPRQLMYRATSLQVEVVDAIDESTARFTDQAPLADRWVIGVEAHDGSRWSIVRPQPLPAQSGDPVRVLFPDQPDAVFDDAGRRLADQPVTGVR